MGIDINQLSPQAQRQIAQKLAAQARESPSEPRKGKSKYNNTPAERSGKNAEYCFVIKLPPVTKKNSQRMAKRGDRLVPIPSKAYTEYQDGAGVFLNPIGIDYPVEITCLFYMKTRRRVDLTNLLEAIDDTLVHYGVVEDDNSKIVVSHDGSRVLYDKENPRTEISIRRVKPCD